MKTIVAADSRWGIGRDNRLLFSIPGDMAFFRKTTLDKVVVMGRNTLRSLPGGAPLKNRTNILLSRSAEDGAQGLVVCASLEALGRALAPYPAGEVFVIGGQSVYAQLLPFCDEALVTRVEADGQADRFFPNLDDAAGWTLAARGDAQRHEGLAYRFCRYVNERPRVLPGNPGHYSKLI